MTKVDIELGEGNYQGSKIFSSLASNLGLSVDLVSHLRSATFPTAVRGGVIGTHPKKCPQPYCNAKRRENQTNERKTSPHVRNKNKEEFRRHAQRK